ncbi:MAG: PrgI family protein [Parcubacteria group bacterium]|jgi:hypothetical protein
MQIVPQYIDVEDKIAGPLTWKHIGWFFGGGVLAFVAWTVLDRMTFIVVAVLLVIATALMAFYRPNGVSMVEFLGYGLRFLFQPKVYTWQREAENVKAKKAKPVTIASVQKEKKLTTDDIAAIAQTLDSHGVERSERIKQLIKERAGKNKE